MLLVGNEMFVTDGEKFLKCYRIQPDGSYEYLGSIENDTGMAFEEPHAIQLESGKIIVHIRVQDDTHYTTFQTESYDGGRTFTKPHQILDIKGGAPAHLMQTKSGLLISTYTYRNAPYGVRVMFSKDEGETWETDVVLNDGFADADLGYPASIELDNGDILTVFYGHEVAETPCKIYQDIWSYSV